jgi:hypothetical protein
MSVTGFGHRSLPAWLPGGIFRGDQTQEFHEFSGVIETGELANVCHRSDRDSAWYAAQGLKGFNHRGQTPRFDRFVECLCETLESFGLLMNRTDIFLKDDVWRRCGTDDLREPPQVGRVPMGPAHRADVLPEQEGFEPKRGGFEIAYGLFTCPAKVPNGFIVHAGDIDGRKIIRACQPGQWHGVPTVGFDTVARLCGKQRWRHDPAIVAFFCQLPGEPGATRSSFIDEDEVVGLGLEFSDEVVDVGLSCPDGAEVGDLSTVILSDIGNSDRLFMDIHSDVERARLWHG